MEEEKISVIGLGHLGLPLAITFALSDFNVIAMDIDEGKIAKLKTRVSPLEETGLQEALLNSKVRKNLVPTSDIRKAILKAKASFILVNTPSRTDGSFSLEYLAKVANDVGKELRNVDFFHVVVVVSTVSPRDCENHIIPILEEKSGKKCGVDFGFVHNPEFVALGSVIHDMLHPDFRVIGEFDQKSGDILERIYKNVSNDTIIRMSIVNAELTKIALNCYLTLKISFANTLAEICQKLDGGNADLITKTLGYDNRISPKFLKAGLGFGGPCFPRDNQALMAVTKSLNSQSFIQEAVVKVNDRQISLVLEKIRQFPDVQRIVILGLSYKPNVPYITESQAFEIVRILVESGDYHITVYDPQAIKFAEVILGNKVEYASSANEAIEKQSDLFLILTPWKEFEDLDFQGQKVLNVWKAD